MGVKEGIERIKGGGKNRIKKDLSILKEEDVLRFLSRKNMKIW